MAYDPRTLPRPPGGPLNRLDPQRRAQERRVEQRPIEPVRDLPAPVGDQFRLEAVAAMEKEPPPLSLELQISESVAVKGRSGRLPSPAEIDQLKAKGKDVLISQLALREALSLGQQDEEFKKREVVQGVVLSIDKYSSLDLDNAISFRQHDDGTMTVGLHAVDVPAWVQLGGALDFSARKRSDTKYPRDADVVFPMLPRCLSEGKLSLFEGQRRLTKSVEMHFSPNGELLDSRIFRSQLVNQFRLNDADAEAAELGSGRGKDAPQLRDALSALVQLGLKVKDNRASRTSRMSKMLEAFTSLSGKVVGEALHQAGYETSYRNQSNAREKARFDAAAKGYATTGALAHATWTAPMRRYADIDVQRTMDKLIDGRQSSERAQEIDSRMRAIELDRGNHVAKEPSMDWLDAMVDVTRKP